MWSPAMAIASRFYSLSGAFVCDSKKVFVPVGLQALRDFFWPLRAGTRRGQAGFGGSHRVGKPVKSRGLN
ncbi:hypothetical protein RCH06_000524 [Polaromonas sp. CG_9.5]|nr:hypothetical protein [Polaromonas sp. CG_9.5]